MSYGFEAMVVFCVFLAPHPHRVDSLQINLQPP